MKTPNRPSPTIKDLYPEATPEQLAQAEQRLQAYARLLLRIADSIRANPERRAKFIETLTDGKNISTVQSSEPSESTNRYL
jgi:hypothetical protein